MGNGRWGKKPGASLVKNQVWVRALGAMMVLLLAGSALLASGSHHGRSVTQVPAFSLPAVANASLSNDSSSRASLSSTSVSAGSSCSNPNAQALLGHLPLMFEPNQGQAVSPVRFLARGAGYGLFLDPSGATLSLRGPSANQQQTVRMKLVGANLSAATSGIDPLPGKTNYILGNDSHKWRTNIPQFAGVRYEKVYPGIDLVFYGNQGQLEYDFRVAPGANPAQAELQFEGVEKMQLRHGDLILTSAGAGGVRLQAPQIYQRVGERRRAVSGRFVLRSANRVGFEIGGYDRSRELIIDPVLRFATYFGGNGSETYPSVAVDGAGNIYLVGSSTSGGVGFPTATLGAAPTTIGTENIFVAKIIPSQPPALSYLTFLGGSGADNSVGIGVDNSQFAYIAGNTTSTNFPVTATAYQGPAPTPKGAQCTGITCTSIFVSVLNSTGTTLNYSTYLSGTGNDVASALAIDLSGDAFITGTTTSTTPADAPSSTVAFPATLLPEPFQITPASSIQFFATKVNTRLSSIGSIAYSTYFGGSNGGSAPVAIGGGIAVDTTGNMYFSGTTNFYNSGLGSYGNSGAQGDFPILNAYQPCLDTPPPTTLGIQNPCSTGVLLTPYQTDAFAAKINPNGISGTQLLFSTYLGGNGNDTGTALAIDSGAANIYLTGSTNSTNFVFPTGTTAYQTCLNTPPPNTTCAVTGPPPFANTDAYVARLSNPTPTTTGTPNDVALTYFSYLGGSGNDSGLAVAVLDSLSTTLNDVVLTGSTSSTNFPISATCAVPPCVIQSTLLGAQNAFFADINTTTTTTTPQNGGSYVTYYGGNGVDRGTSIAVDSNQNTYLAGDTTSTNLQTVNPLQSALNGPSDAFVLQLGTATDVCIGCIAPTISTEGFVGAGNAVSVTFTVANEGPDPATNITVTGTVSSGGTMGTATAGTGSCSTPSGSNVVCQIPTLQTGATSTIVLNVTPTQAATYAVTASVFNANNTSTSPSASLSFTAGGFNLSVNPAGQTVAAGLSATYSVQLNPVPYFANSISLSCSGLPSGAQCNFAPTLVTLNSSAQSPQLTITTTPQPVPTAGLGRRGGMLWAFGLMIPGLGLVGVGASGKRRNRLFAWLAMCALFALVFLQPACSSGKTQPVVSGTPSGTYQVTVTASSGAYSKSALVSLTVTP